MKLGYNHIARNNLFEAIKEVAENYAGSGVATLSDHQGIGCCVDVAFTLSSDPSKAVHVTGYPNFSTYGSDMHIRARIVSADKIIEVNEGVQVDIRDVPTEQVLPDFESRFTIAVGSAKKLEELLSRNVGLLN